MKIVRYIGKIIFSVLLCLTLCTCESAVTSPHSTNGTKDIDKQTEVSKEVLDFSYTGIVLDDGASKSVRKAAGRIKSALISLGVTVRIENDEDTHTALLLIGDTGYSVSESAAGLLPEDGGFVLSRSGRSLALYGSNDDALIQCCEYFVNHLAVEISDGRLEIGGDYNYVENCKNNIKWTDDFFGIETLQSTEIFGPSKENPALDLAYSRVMVLEHSGKNNGVVIATGESLKLGAYLIHRSTDGGRTFEQVGRVRGGKWIADWQPMLYELPHALGDLPEGTLLLAGCSRNQDISHTEITIYVSTDLGESWNVLSTVAEGGGFGQVNGMNNGMYEPFLLYENGLLYCFYSDETDCLNHSQMIVCRSSADGINWSGTQRIVACADKNLRPGMPTVTKMGNGKYFLTYEMVGMDGNPIHYKTTDDLSDWGDPSSNGTKLQTPQGVSLGSSPYCCWIPFGSEKGTLMVTAHHMVGGSSDTGTDWLISTDYGKSFKSIPNPLPYQFDDSIDHSRCSYSPCIFAADDGHTVYYVNNINSEAVPSESKMQLMILKIHGFGQHDSVRPDA